MKDIIGHLHDLRAGMNITAQLMRVAVENGGPAELKLHADELNGAANTIDTWIEGISREK